MKIWSSLIIFILFLTACGNDDELENRYFSGESDNWQGEITLELKPTTEPYFETTNMELVYNGDGDYDGSIRGATLDEDGRFSVSSGTSSDEDGVYRQEYVHYGLEEIYLNGSQFGVNVSWRNGGEDHEEQMYFEEIPDKDK